jgi:hypothetical protein
MIARVTSIKLALTGATAALVLSACGAGASGPPSTHTVSPTASGKLQFAVGTANIYGIATGLNVVSTFRASDGRSPVEVNAPTISGPFTFGTLATGCSGGGVSDLFTTVFPSSTCSGTTQDLNVPPGGGTGYSGPSAQEWTAAIGATSASITSTSPGLSNATFVCDSYTPCTSNGGTVLPNTTTFGQGGGVFAMGLQPANLGNSGTPYTGYAPYPLPLYDQNTSTVEPTTTPWGGPPSLDADGKGMGTRDGTYDVGAVLGVNEGVTVFQGLVPSAGTYTLAVSIPTGVNAQGGTAYGTVSSTSTLTATAPVIATATSPVMTEDGTGGGTFPGFALPAGATEALIQVVDYGPGGPGTNDQNCAGSASGSVGTNIGPVYYTIVYHAGGAAPVLPDNDGPNLDAGLGSSKFDPGPSICTAAQNTTALGAATGADIYSTQVIAVDYPLYEASQLFGAQSPTIVGAAGQDDISISFPTVFTYGTPGGAPLATSVAKFRKGQRVMTHESAAIKRLL